jgi:hypothetical protein
MFRLQATLVKLQQRQRQILRQQHHFLILLVTLVDFLRLTWSASTDASGFIITMFTEKKIIQVFFRLLDKQLPQHLMTFMLLMVMDTLIK